MAENHSQDSTTSNSPDNAPLNASDQIPHPASPVSNGAPAPDVQKETKKRKKNSGKKQGRPSIFQGEHLAYLEARGKEYLALSEKKARTRWLGGLEEDWFSKYPWHLGTEPEEFAALYTTAQGNPAGAEDQGTPSVQLSDEARQDLKKRCKAAQDAVVKEGQEVHIISF